MIKGYSDFINENNEEDDIEKLYKGLIGYIVSELNKGTEYIHADPIKESDVAFHIDTSDVGEKWFYCTIQSERLSSEPEDEPVDDHMRTLIDVANGFSVLDKILEKIHTDNNVFIHSMVSKGGMTHRAAIKFTVEEQKIVKNKKSLYNLLRSIKGINKFGL